MANEDILKLIKERRSVRKYKKQKIERENILKILEAGRFAPSAENNQPWRFFVLTSEEKIKEVGSNCRLAFLNTFAPEAALIIVIYTDRKHRFVETDCALCAQNMMLEASSIGIGSCYIGAFREKRIKKLLNLDEKQRIIGLIAFGYPAEFPIAPDRLPLEAIAKFDEDLLDKKQVTSVTGLVKKGFPSLVVRFFKRLKK